MVQSNLYTTTSSVQQKLQAFRTAGKVSIRIVSIGKMQLRREVLAQSFDLRPLASKVFIARFLESWGMLAIFAVQLFLRKYGLCYVRRLRHRASHGIETLSSTLLHRVRQRLQHRGRVHASLSRGCGFRSCQVSGYFSLLFISLLITPSSESQTCPLRK